MVLYWWTTFKARLSGYYTSYTRLAEDRSSHGSLEILGINEYRPHCRKDI